VCYTTASRGISSFTFTDTTLDSCITYTYRRCFSILNTNVGPRVEVGGEFEPPHLPPGSSVGMTHAHAKGQGQGHLVRKWSVNRRTDGRRRLHYLPC